MKKILLAFSLCLLSITSANATDVTFSWEHDGKDLEGFNFYVGDSSDTTKMTVLQKITTATTRTYLLPFAYDTVKCFGVSAYNKFGESSIVARQENGDDTCLGKPLAPRAFSFSAQ